jgi:hypothetical protein
MQLPHDMWFISLGVLVGFACGFFVNHPKPIVKNYPTAIQMHGDK